MVQGLILRYNTDVSSVNVDECQDISCVQEEYTCCNTDYKYKHQQTVRKLLSRFTNRELAKCSGNRQAKQRRQAKKEEKKTKSQNIKYNKQKPLQCQV